jgi:L-asparagine transporter-like permease
MSGVIEPAGLGRYLLQFTGIYLLAAVAIFAVTYFFDFDAPSAMGIILLVAACSGVANSFVTRTRRVMTGAERRTLAIAVTAISTAISAAGLWLSTFDPAFAQELNAMLADQNFAWILALITLVFLLAYFLIAYFTLGFFGKSTLKRLQKTSS